MTKMLTVLAAWPENKLSQSESDHYDLENTVEESKDGE
jgi:hypothetical protein